MTIQKHACRKHLMFEHFQTLFSSELRVVKMISDVLIDVSSYSLACLKQNKAPFKFNYPQKFLPFFPFSFVFLTCSNKKVFNWIKFFFFECVCFIGIKLIHLKERRKKEVPSTRKGRGVGFWLKKSSDLKKDHF